MVAKAVISPEARLANIRAFTKNFHDQHISQTQGMILSVHQRIAVVLKALVDVEACSQVGGQQSCCLRPGFAFDVIHDVQKNVSSDIATLLDPVLITLVYTTINHQIKVDAKYYGKAIKALLNESEVVLPDHISETTRTSLLTSLYAEVTCLAALSHSLDMIFHAIGEPLPVLPQFGEVDDIKPSMIDLSSILRPGKSIQADAKYGFVPIVRGTLDLDATKLRKAFDANNPDAIMAYYDDLWYGKSGYNPNDGWSMSPPDNIMFPRFLELLIYSGKHDVMLPYKSLDPAVFCTDQFTRHEKEEIFIATAAVHDCAF